jgi:RNA polymerase sigma-70 factor, ECF subfamily
VHAGAVNATATDRAQIVSLYDALAQVALSPVVALNRAVAVAMRDGPAVGLALIDAILAHGDLADYHLAHAAGGSVPGEGPKRGPQQGKGRQFAHYRRGL